MPLSTDPTTRTAQLLTLKGDIAANVNPIPAGRPFAGTAINALPNSGDANFEIALWYSSQAIPNFWVFRSSVTTDKARESIDWTEVLTGAPLPTLKQWAFDTLTKNGSFNPSLENERVGFTSIFSGTGYANTRNNLLSASTRLANRIEKLFFSVATGPNGGNGSTQATAAVTAVEGSISGVDVEQARNS